MTAPLPRTASPNGKSLRPVRRMKGSSIATILLAAVASTFLGCSSGPMNVDETYYLGASNGSDSVYYRVKIEGRTKHGKAEFRQGWYPAYAVDALFGDMSSEGRADSLNTRDEIKRQIDTKLIAAYKNYLEIAVNIESEEADINRAMSAVLHVRLAAREQLSGTLNGAAIPIEYNPVSDLVTRRAGQKLVMLLSSDPDDIVQQLSQIADDARTQQVISQFAQVLEARTIADRASEQSQFSAHLNDRDIVIAQLAYLDAVLGDNTNQNLDRAQILAAINASLSVLESAKQGAR